MLEGKFLSALKEVRDLRVSLSQPIQQIRRNGDSPCSAAPECRAE